jgi:hypothetical protein
MTRGVKAMQQMSVLFKKHRVSRQKENNVVVCQQNAWYVKCIIYKYAEEMQMYI